MFVKTKSMYVHLCHHFTQSVIVISFQILVRTMHKYMAVIDISVVGENVMGTNTFVFMETTFIAVTSYLSLQVSKIHYLCVHNVTSFNLLVDKLEDKA